MEAQKINLLEFMGSSKRTFNIPVYQRNYDWKTSHCQRLFEDIEKIAIDDKRESHFLGTIVYVDGKKTASFREFIVIDGQQRLTSTMLLLKALADKMEDNDLKEDILESYLINKRAPEELRIKLKPIESDSKIYEKLIKKDEIHETSSNIYNNYEYFLKLIDGSELSPEEIYRGMEKLEIVYIALDSEKENPQLIFESLNSTGLDLTQADLIRNYLLMGLNYELQNNLYENYWVEIEILLTNTYISDYIRDYLTLKTCSIPNKNKVYDEFKIYYEQLKLDTPEELLKDLVMYAQYYSWFINCNSGIDEIDEKLSDISKLKNKVVYPFLLYIFELYEDKKVISKEELINILSLIISYSFRRLICDIPTNALNKIFCTMVKDINEVKAEIGIFEKIAIVLANKSGKGIFPNNEMLKESLLKKDFYNFKQGKFFLYSLEKYCNKEVVEEESLNIEHIMPQTLTPKWKVDLGNKYASIYGRYLNTIGNLTLTAYNSELSNSDFDSKKEIYKDSNIKITRELLEYDSWNEESIRKRINKIYDKSIEIWKYPNEIIKANTLNKEEKKVFDIMDDVNVTGREVCELTILSEKISVSTWKGFFEEICKKLYAYDSDIFNSLTKHKDFKGKTRRIITKNKNELRTPCKIGEGVYIEQNLNANGILNYSKLVVDKYDGFEDEISYRLK